MVELIPVVHVDDILVSGEKEACDELYRTLNGKFPTENLGELKWYLGCAVERDWQQGGVTIKQPAMIDTLIKRFNVTAQSDPPLHQPSLTQDRRRRMTRWWTALSGRWLSVSCGRPE